VTQYGAYHARLRPCAALRYNGTMTIAAGLSATKTGFDLIKSVRELVKRPDIDASEVSARLLELQELMLDARTALSEAQEEKVKLEARITELSRMADFGKDFTMEEGVYWRESVPYCPICWDVDRKSVRLAGPSKNTGGFHGQLAWHCPFHKSSFGISVDKSSLK
jgi:hypothetical protein